MKNIILIATLLIFAGCSSDDTKDKKQEVKEVVQKKVKQAPKELIEKKEVVTKKEPIVEVPKKEIQKVKEVKKVIVKEEIKVEEPKEEVKKITKASKSGKDIYKACVACHGLKADKAALGKSKIIKGWDATRISSALNGYKDGTYGGPMKALMIGQAGFLSDEEVEAVSEYISKL